MKTAYGYCRASTGKQELTFEAQRRAILAHYEAKLRPDGFAWGGFYEDKATSGGTAFAERDRGRVLWVVAQPGDAVVWSKMDRAFRSVRDGSETLHLLKQKGISVHSLDIGLDTSTALGDFVCKLLMLLGELERSWVSTRTKDALAAKRAMGLPVYGRAPAGWWVAGKKKLTHLRQDSDERARLDEIYKRYAAGESLEKISNELHFKGVLRKGGTQYDIDWLLYALHARALGYPTHYDHSNHKQLIASVRKSGKPWRGRINILQRLADMQAARAAHRSGREACPSETSASS